MRPRDLWERKAFILQIFPFSQNFSSFLPSFINLFTPSPPPLYTHLTDMSLNMHYVYTMIVGYVDCFYKAIGEDIYIINSEFNRLNKNFKSSLF